MHQAESRRYTPEDNALILQRRREGVGFEAIRRELGRPSAHTVGMQYQKLMRQAAERRAAPVRQITVRPCLCCRKPFSSEGAHNRMCDPCRGEAQDLSPLLADAFSCGYGVSHPETCFSQALLNRASSDAISSVVLGKL